MRASTISLVANAGSALAAIHGFNYGALYADNRARMQADWEADFKAALDLPGVGDFTSARLFTMIQAYTTADVTQAIPAAIDTKTSLLLGLWCSSGSDAFNNELTALTAAIKQYGDQIKPVGISVGSEDLYRISVQGIKNKSGPGAEPDQIVNYIKQVRDAIKGTAWSDVTIGHVETFNDYTNSSNSAVISAIDWLGMDAYPYYQTTDNNTVSNGGELFFEALAETQGVSQGKPVWITETGWPVTGPNSGEAVAGTANAESYWKQVACKLFGQGTNYNAWWYQLNDGAPQETSFKVINPDRGQPLYSLSCAGVSNTTSSMSSSTKTASGSSTVVGAQTASATAVSGGSPGMNQQNAGTQAKGGDNTVNGNSTSTVGVGAGGSGSSGSSGNSTGATPVSPSSTDVVGSRGAAAVNAPVLGLLALGALVAAAI